MDNVIIRKAQQDSIWNIDGDDIFIIPSGLFNKEVVEKIVGQQVSEEEYMEFKEFMDASSMDTIEEAIINDIKESWGQFSG